MLAVTNLSTFNVRLEMDIPNSHVTNKYIVDDVKIAQNIPKGILCRGLCNLSILDIPDNTPVTEGYNKAKQEYKFGKTPVYGSGSNRLHVFSLNDRSYCCKFPVCQPPMNNIHPRNMSRMLITVMQRKKCDSTVTYLP